MPRPINLAIFSNGKKPAHWAIFIPHIDDKEVGKVIHVTGNPATGFFLQFKRGYDFRTTPRYYEFVHLFDIEDRIVTDTSETTIDTIARDRLESVATTVQPPGRSPNPFDPQAPNCQNWILDYVEALVGVDLFPSDALEIVKGAKRYL